MHPAPSIIFFTSASGLGLGLAAWIVLGLVDMSNVFHLILVASIVFGLIGAGLLSSTLHLGHPERAWRALSQWRSSWLSREGVLAVLVLGALTCWFSYNYFYGSPPEWSAWILILLIALTVYATSMIYASLKTVTCWYHPLTPACYLMFSASGGLLATIWLIVTAGQIASVEIQILAAVLLVAAWLTKFFWWRMLKTNGSISTLETATGLGSLGKVRSLMPPHTSENYLQKEMGFVIAPPPPPPLRVISVLMGGLIPLFLLFLTSTSSIALGLAVVLHLFGVFVERWLFFAEAKHVVNLYYGD